MIAFLHLQVSDIRAIIIVVFANIARIVSYKNKILRSKIAIFVFISLNVEKRRQSDELKQYLLRAMIAVLSANKNSYKDNFIKCINDKTHSNIA
jgi:hypothetical protein